MKNLFKFIAFLVVVLQFICCRNYLSSEYTVSLPALPENWEALLGQPHWRIEWFDSGGQIHTKDIQSDEKLTVELPSTWTSPVTAWPYWPLHNLPPRLFKPAGGFFPFDVSAAKINLAWEAGPDAIFYWELALSNIEDKTKIPANFDWLRFRELFATGDLNDAVCKDPWLIDWKSVAEKTISSGFDRRRLVPAPAVSMSIPAGTVPWYGASPFADPLVFTEEIPDSVLPCFPVRSGVNVWVSAEGILRVSGDVWVLQEIILWQ